MKKLFIKSKGLALIIFADVLLIAAVCILMSYVQFLLKNDIEINLSEIVTQNKNVVASKLAVELNNIEMASKQLSSYMFSSENTQDEENKEIFMRFIKDVKDSSLVYTDINGMSTSATGESVDISGRGYFRLAMQGISNISERLISRLDGKDIFALCVPIIHEEKIVGALHKYYTPQEMYALCSVSLFAEKGFSYIINSQGYILISSENSQYNRESDNYYRIVYLSDPEASKQFEEDIKNNRSGFFEAELDGRRVFSAYTPIEEIYDWYLISSIDTEAVSPNSNIVVKLFYFILIVIAFLFLVSNIYYWRLKRTQKQKLEQIAFVDTVTNGFTYAKFELYLQDLLNNKPEKIFYICSLDIDNFKFINNFYGYETGNRILQHIYAHYKSKLVGDECIARVTGDQFVLLIDATTENRIESLFDFEIVFENIKNYISVGVYQVTDLSQSISIMLDKARTTACKSKGMHFKKVEYYNEEDDNINLQNEQTKRAVELALSDNEIIPYFQPKVDINTNKLVGAEALARWKTKDGEIVPPYKFIPLCEHTGLITLVDLTIFEQTLKFIKRNIDSGVDCVPISVNFSRLHLLNREFHEEIISKLRFYNIPPELIEIEITETVMFENSELINQFIENLHKMGLKISMDDFGAGYSSLHMLKDINIDILKMDSGFLKGSESNNRQRIIFGSAAQMAQNLNINVVVEGVETIENVNLMKEFNCSCAQGYFFAKPMPMENFESIYKEGHI